MMEPSRPASVYQERRRLSLSYLVDGKARWCRKICCEEATLTGFRHTNRAGLAGKGIALSDLPDGGMLASRAGSGLHYIPGAAKIFAVSAVYIIGPLAEGWWLADGSLPLAPCISACAPARRWRALSPVSCFRVERRNGRVCSEKLEKAAARALTSPHCLDPSS
jgi:hypothetical protein